ncbi:MAG: transcriptional regulator [Deltaproteobacteria bacterium]|nr:transcriptional regulator [Deltaproteobacteria bacterium]
MEKYDDRCQCRIIHEDRVGGARRKALRADEIEGLSQFFKAFADPTRLRIIRALEEEEMCVCDLAAFLEVSESAVSHQLRLLRQLKLVVNRRQGQVLYYRLADDHVSRVAELALEHIRE